MNFIYNTVKKNVKYLDTSLKNIQGRSFKNICGVNKEIVEKVEDFSQK